MLDLYVKCGLIINMLTEPTFMHMCLLGVNNLKELAVTVDSQCVRWEAVMAHETTSRSTFTLILYWPSYCICACKILF